MMIEEMENNLIPKGSIDLVGFGRLGMRIGINLVQIHRGGPKYINIFDGQKVSESDIIFLLNGAKVGEYKTEFLKRLCNFPEDFRKINYVNEYISDENIDLISSDVVVSVIAGGNTIPTTAKIIKRAHSLGSKTISTAGVFGIGEEDIVVKDISEFDDSNPAVEELRKEGINKNHLMISTNKFIRDKVPITPYTLDNISKVIVRESLKLL